MLFATATATLALGAAAARAETIAAPAGARPISLSAGRVVCGTPAGGWTTDPARHTLAPPAAAPPGTRADLVLAAAEGACATAGQHVTVVVTAPWPAIERAVLSVDDGRLELFGPHVAGVQVRWKDGATAGVASCDPPPGAAPGDGCGAAVAIDPGTTWSWWPAGAPTDPGVTLYDRDGHVVGPDALALSPGRTEVAMIVRPDAVIDALSGGAVVPLRHPELIATVDCAPAACVIDGGSLLVSNVPASASSLAIRVRLAPHVVLRHGDAAETSPVLRIPIVRCPLAVVSGAPLRGVDAQKVVVALGGRCARDIDRLRFEVAGVQAEHGAVISSGELAYVPLHVGRIDSDSVALAAVIDGGDEVVAQLRVPTRAAPRLHVALELGHHTIDFIPTNVAADARVASADWDGSLRLAPIDGVYTVPSPTTLRGMSSAAGMVALRVALHRALPAPLGDIEIATVPEPVERPLHEATSIAPLLGNPPLVEMLCDDGGGPSQISPGATAHVPFDHHDSCRLVLHRERLDPAMGPQKLMLEVDVTRVDGSPRSEARVARRLEMVHDDAPRTLWLRGADGRFDRYTVRLSQDEDEHAPEGELPAAQWSIVTGKGHARIYATSAIPTGLYRVSDRDHSGILTLNFGVLARATWLDSLGREGILCLEGGALTVGLANDTSSTGRSLTQIATVFGVGLSVPIANRALAAETSVNLHAWLELEPSRAFGSGSGSAWAFVFGPSITVGNLGADL